jgi:hypothetical protein
MTQSSVARMVRSVCNQATVAPTYAVRSETASFVVHTFWFEEVDSPLAQQFEIEVRR